MIDYFVDIIPEGVTGVIRSNIAINTSYIMEGANTRIITPTNSTKGNACNSLHPVTPISDRSVMLEIREIATVTPIPSITPCNYTPCDLEERIAYVQHESGLPEAWAEAFARLDCMARPTSISQATWQHIVHNTGLLLDRHINDIITHGWSVADIFGVHKHKPEGRYNYMGLLILLGNSAVIQVSADKITMQASNGKPQGFYRMRVSNQSEQIMIWEL